MKTLTLSIGKELTNEDRVNFVCHFFESDYLCNNTIKRKSTMRKFLSAIFGKIKAEELIQDFWTNSDFILGEGSDLVTIIWKEKGPTFPIDKFKHFLSKVMPEIIVTESIAEETPRIEFLKYAFARAISSENGDTTISLSSKLTVDEVEKLVDVQASMNFGYKYYFEQFECDTCRGYHEDHPIHLEFQPMWEFGFVVATL